MSVQHWGESSAGDWTIKIYFSSDDGSVSVGDPAVVFYGTTDIPESVKSIPDECSIECVRGCAAEGEEYCDSCRNHRMATDLRCVSSCPGERANWSEDGNSSHDGPEQPCTVGGYCMDCNQRLLLLSVPIIVLITVSGLVVLIGGIFVSFVLWSKFSRSSQYVNYVSI